MEGPCWDGAGGVYFSDVLGGGVHHWSQDGGPELPDGGSELPDGGARLPGAVETVLPKRRGIGGMALHAGGGVVVSGRDVSRVQPGEGSGVRPADEGPGVLLAAEGVTGFNDLCTDARGHIYVGALRFHPFKGEPSVPGGIWRIEGAGRAAELTREIDWPNGMGLSPGGDTLYACDYAHGHVLAWEVSDEGGVSGRRVFARAPAGSCDGLAVDRGGGVWVALGDGGAVARFQPGGTLDSVLDVPASFVTSLCFGGHDLRDLYVTTADNARGPERGGTLFRARVDFPGLPVTPATV